MRALAHQYFCWFGRTNSQRSAPPLIWPVHRSYWFFCTNQIVAINFLWALQLKLDPPTDKKAGTQICQDQTPTRLVWARILAVKESQSSWYQQAAHSKRKTSAIFGASLTSGRGLGQDGARRGEPAGGIHFSFPCFFFIPASKDHDVMHDYHRMCRNAATVRLDANCSRAERVGLECK